MAAVPYGAIITQLLNANRIQRERIKATPEQRALFEGRGWLQEFCTIHVGAARQTGKTTAAYEFIDSTTLWLNVNTPLFNGDKASIARLYPNRPLPDMMSLYQVDMLMRKGAVLEPKYTRYIVDNATPGFEHCPRKQFYKFVMQTACIEDPEIILIG
jgi:hypothetical protein